MTDRDRYQGKPLLRLFELYVLWSIGELSRENERTLVEMTPKLHAIYGASGSWQDVIATIMQESPDLPVTLRAMWSRNLDLAREGGVKITPQQFAEMVVDENFAI